MTKVGLAKEAAARGRAAKTALGTLAPELREAVKPQDEVRTSNSKPSSEPNAVYGIFVDNQGVPYLRVATTPKGTKFILSTGARVDVAELDELTVRSRALELAPEASVLEAAKILLRPLSSGVIISERAKKYLEQIIADPNLAAAETKKEEVMAKAKGTKKAKAAVKKAAATNGHVGRPALSLDSMIVLKKGPKEDAIKRHVDILEALKEGGGKMTLKALAAAFGKAAKTKQDPVKVFGMHRKALVDGGFISISEQ